MQFPENPTCHGEMSRFGPTHWREPDMSREPYGYPFRTCSYCGSIHPEDLMKYLTEGATLGGADWKYGWPHKFYVEGIPNPKAGQMVNCGGKSWTENGERKYEPTISPGPPHTPAKWYNEHLQDAGFDDEAFNALLTALSERSGIRWFKNEEGKVMFEALFRGYQKY